MKTKKIILIGIILLAFFLRFYKLSEIPPGVNRDEASIGYTAYSLLKTGKDEYGRIFPISFQSFGDWKLPLYIYLTLPLVAVFGLLETSVRVVSGLAGVATVALTYFLVRELLTSFSFQQIDRRVKADKARKEKIDVDKIALLTTGLLAISPWHLHLSRVESESNLAVFLITLATLLFIKSFKGKKSFLIFSSFLFSLTYFTYHGNHIFTTLLLLGLFVLFQKKIPRNKTTLISALIFLLFTGFILSKTLFSANLTKLSGISIFSDPTVVHTQIELPRNEHDNRQSFFSKIMHNRVTFALEKFGQNYIKTFSPEFLFIKGGENKAHNIEGFGNMYLIEMFFLLLGVFYLILSYREKRFSRQAILFIFWWFLVAPIASSITKDAPHTNRIFAIFPILPLITAFGILAFMKTISQYKFFKKIILVVIASLFLLNFVIYLDRYFIHFPVREAENWGVSYKELFGVLDKELGDYEEVIISRPETSPYIFLLFYQSHDPLTFQQEVTRYPENEEGFRHVKAFDRYQFRDINYPEDLRIVGRLLIDKTLDMPTEATNSSYLTGTDSKGQQNYTKTRVKKQIELPSGKPIFTVLETYSVQKQIDSAVD